MPELTSHLRSSPTSIRSKSVALILGFCALCGCHRGPSGPALFSVGYVRLDDLVRLHPSWEDVKRMGALLAHARSIPDRPAATQGTLASVSSPPPLNRASDSRERLV